MNGLIGTIYGFINIFFMMWYGYGGEKSLNLPDSIIFITTSYILITTAAVYLPLFLMSESARKVAIYGLIPPWIVIIIIALPQKEAPEMFLFCSGIISVLLLTRRPIEQLIGKIKA